MDIEIRRAEPNDHVAITRIFSAPEVIRATLQLPFPSAEYWRRRLADPADGEYRLVASVRGEVVGVLGLHMSPNVPRRAHAASIGMAVRDDWQGRGVGNALMQAAVDLADNWLNLIRLELTVFVDNDAAIQLYQKHGFITEGTLAGFVFREGEYVDVYVMARIRP